jgi:hypothetical protein
MRSILCLLGLLLLPALVNAAHSIQAVKGNKVLLQLDESPTAVDDVFLAKDANGVEKAQIQIRQIKDKRAIAIIIKGELTQAPDTYELVPGPKPEVTTAKPAATPAGPSVPQAKGYYGGISQNQMNVSLTNSTTLALKGTSFNFGAFYERALTHRVQVLARAGYEGLKATGSLSSNACGSSCDVDISYLGADAVVKYSFYDNKKTWWLGGGLGFLFPIIKSSNVIDTGKMTLNEKIILSAGLNWYRTTNTFIPVQLDYALQPSNSIVTTSQFILRVGYGTAF